MTVLLEYLNLYQYEWQNTAKGLGPARPTLGYRTTSNQCWVPNQLLFHNNIFSIIIIPFMHNSFPTKPSRLLKQESECNSLPSLTLTISIDNFFYLSKEKIHIYLPLNHLSVDTTVWKERALNSNFKISKSYTVSSQSLAVNKLL